MLEVFLGMPMWYKIGFFVYFALCCVISVFFYMLCATCYSQPSDKYNNDTTLAIGILLSFFLSLVWPVSCAAGVLFGVVAFACNGSRGGKGG